VFAWRVPTGNCTPDVSVSKTDSPDPAKVGQNLTYTMTVTNVGSAAAGNVTLTDQLPKNAGFGSVATTRGSCSLKPEKRTVTCNLGAIAEGASATVTIVVKPTQKGTITNTATVSAPGDSNTSNNSATATTVVRP
jgi:uncharacterized repeat protein (TIGR01451 family)